MPFLPIPRNPRYGGAAGLRSRRHGALHRHSARPTATAPSTATRREVFCLQPIPRNPRYGGARGLRSRRHGARPSTATRRREFLFSKPIPRNPRYGWRGGVFLVFFAHTSDSEVWALFLHAESFFVCVFCEGNRPLFAFFSIISRCRESSCPVCRVPSRIVKLSQ